jgi:hypothetical protein
MEYSKSIRISQTFLKWRRMILRGERMRKVLVFLLIVGILIGTFSVVERICEEESFQRNVEFSNEDEFEGSPGDPAPCGRGGSGGGTPG